jgi:hypothetical protein
MLAELIHPIAAMGYEEWPYRPRPSNAGPEICIRKLSYQANEIAGKDPHGRFLVVLDDGTWHEELVLNWIEKTVFQLHSRQLRVTCGTTTWNGRSYDINGAIDGIVTDLLGVDRLLELKGHEHFTFTRFSNGDYPINHFTQCAMYVTGVQRINPEINECLLLIKNKNQSAFLEFRLRYDTDADRLTVVETIHSNGEHTFPNQEFIGLYKQAMTKFDQIETHREFGTLPARPFENDDSYHCHYCPYRAQCWEGFVRQPLTGMAELRTELIPTIEEYLKLEAELKPKNKRFKEVKQLLKLELTSQHIQRAQGQGYVLAINESTEERLDQSLLPADLVERSKTTRKKEELEVYRFHQKAQKRKQSKQTESLAS